MFHHRSFPFILAAPFNHPRIRGITSQLFSCQTSACGNPVNKSNLQLSGHTFVYKQSVGNLTLAQFLKHVIINQKRRFYVTSIRKLPIGGFRKKRNRSNTSTGARPDRKVRFILGELFDT